MTTTKEPRGSRVMLRRCIFLILTSENFSSRYGSPSGFLARHIAGVGRFGRPARHEATVPSFLLRIRSRRKPCGSSLKEYFIATSIVCPIKSAIYPVLGKNGMASVGPSARGTRSPARQMLSRLYVQSNALYSR